MDDEIKNFEYMIRLYCKKKHHNPLCNRCSELLEYAKARIKHCRYKESKTFCSVCKTPCYKSDMREQIRQVMKFSGPRMLLHRPGMALKHMAVTIKAKRSK